MSGEGTSNSSFLNSNKPKDTEMKEIAADWPEMLLIDLEKFRKVYSNISFQILWEENNTMNN